MTIGKLKFSKDWKDDFKTKSKKDRPSRRTLQLEVIKSEDLPELIAPKKAAQMLHMHYKTLENERRDGKIKFIKRGGRYFTTPEWIAEYLETYSKIA